MVPKLGNVPALRAKVLQRKKHPIQKINSILARKYRFATGGSAVPELMSHELGFYSARAPRQKRTKLVYSVKKAGDTFVAMGPEPIGAYRKIHTHPLLLVGTKLRQKPGTSPSDLAGFLSSNLRSTIVAVPSRRDRTRIAGVFVVRKRPDFSEQMLVEKYSIYLPRAENLTRLPSFWAEEMQKFLQRKSEMVAREPAQKVKEVFEKCHALSTKLYALNGKIEEAQRALEYASRTLRDRMQKGQITQVQYAELMRKEHDSFLEKVSPIRPSVEEYKGKIKDLLDKNQELLRWYGALSMVADTGFVDFYLGGREGKTVPFEHLAFQIIAQKKGEKVSFRGLGKESMEEMKRIMGQMKLSVRLVPAEGFELRNGQFEEKKK